MTVNCVLGETHILSPLKWKSKYFLLIHLQCIPAKNQNHVLTVEQVLVTILIINSSCSYFRANVISRQKISTKGIFYKLSQILCLDWNLALLWNIINCRCDDADGDCAPTKGRFVYHFDPLSLSVFILYLFALTMCVCVFKYFYT